MKGKLSYFDLGGRGEASRIALSLAGVQYEDERFGFADWPAIKGDTTRFPMGSAPVWTESDGEVVFGSNIILRMIGARNGMYSNDPEIAWQIDSVMEFVEEGFDKKLAPYISAQLMGGAGGTDE